MTGSEKGPVGPGSEIEYSDGDSQLSALMRSHANQYYGSGKGFMRHLGLSELLFTEWLKGRRDLLNSPHIGLIAEELGRVENALGNVKTLQFLGGVTVVEASLTVLRSEVQNRKSRT